MALTSKSPVQARSDRSRRLLLVLIAALAIMLPGYALYAQSTGAALLALLVVLGLCHRAGGQAWAANALLTVGALTLGVLGTELALRTVLSGMVLPTHEHGIDLQALARRAAADAGRSYDKRSLSEVILASRARGERAFPASSPSHYLRAASDGGTESAITIDGEEVLPLGLLPNAAHIYCNESGEYPVFRSDAFGFINPRAVWELPSTDLLAVGDSFTMGACVPSGASFVDLLRARYPATVNLGMGANGPLLTLAALTEYGPILRPRKVLWAYFENDLRDLDREKRSALLRRYLQPGFSQRLAERRETLTPPIEAFVESYWAAIRRHAQHSTGFAPDATTTIARFLQASELGRVVRAALGDHAMLRRTIEADRSASPDWALFRQVLDQARRRVQAWGGELVFVYLPECVHYRRFHGGAGYDFHEATTIRIVRELSLPLISMAERFRADEEPLDNYYYCPGSHFSAAGNRQLAMAIIEALTPGAEGATTSAAKSRR